MSSTRSKNSLSLTAQPMMTSEWPRTIFFQVAGSSSASSRSAWPSCSSSAWRTELEVLVLVDALARGGRLQAAGHSMTPRTKRAQGGSRSRSRSQMNMRRMKTVRSPNSRTDATEPGGTNRKPFSGTVTWSWPISTFQSVQREDASGSVSWKARAT